MKTTFTSRLLLFFLFTTIILFTSCDDLILRGEGDFVSRTRPVGNYSEIDVSDKFEVYLTQGPSKDIIIEAQENLLPEIITEVKNNKLVIEFNHNRVKTSKTPRIYLTTPTLTELAASGAISIKGLNEWQVNDLKMDLSGSGKINLNIKGANNLASEISGSGDIELTGEANTYALNVSGSGKLHAYDLITKTANVEISGSGNCEITVTDQLTAKISGSGKVRYKGNPVVNTNISGSGSVNQVQ